MVMTSRDEESIFWLVRCIERFGRVLQSREKHRPGLRRLHLPLPLGRWVGYPFTAFLFSPPPHTLRYHCRISGFCSIRMSGQHIKLLPSAHNRHSSQWGQQPERSSPRHCRFCRCRNIMIRFAGDVAGTALSETLYIILSNWRWSLQGRQQRSSTEILQPP